MKKCSTCGGTGQLECDEEGNMYAELIDCDDCGGNGEIEEMTKEIVSVEECKELPSDIIDRAYKEQDKLPKIYFCFKCNRYTDVRYISDKQGGRNKSYCYKCHDEMLVPVFVTEALPKRTLPAGEARLK